MISGIQAAVKGLFEAWGVVDMALPASPAPRAIAKALIGGMLQHDLRELVPLMQESGFFNVELAPVNYRVLFLPVLSFVRGRAGREAGMNSQHAG